MSSVDVYPSLLELAGLPPRNDLDGVSLFPLLSGAGGLERDALFWHFPCYTGRGTPASAIRSGDWKLVQRFESAGPELYDLATDPFESTNRAADEPRVTHELLDRLEEWRAVTGAKLPEGDNAAFDPDAKRGRGGPNKEKKRNRERKRDR